MYLDWLPSFELESSCGYDSLADVVISSSISPNKVTASDDVVLGTDLARGGFCLFPSAISSLAGGFIFFRNQINLFFGSPVKLYIFGCAQSARNLFENTLLFSVQKNTVHFTLKLTYSIQFWRFNGSKHGSHIHAIFIYTLSLRTTQNCWESANKCVLRCWKCLHETVDIFSI